MNPKVSIIVPCYGVEKYLEKCVKSLIGQTLRDIEIILVDDKSPDGTPVLCDQWVAKDERVEVIHKSVNEGLGMACNTGLDAAAGEYVAFCDSDDWVDAEMYKAMYKVAKKNDADAVFSGIQTVDQYGVVRLMAEPKRFEVIEGEKVKDFLLDMIGKKPSAKEDRDVQMSAKITLYRLEMIRKYGLRFVSEREMISEDLIWHIDILGHAQRIVTIPKTFYYYYNNTDSLTKTVRTDRFSFFLSLREEVVRRCIELGISEEVKVRAERLFMGHCRQYMKQICKSAMSYKEKKQLMKQICSHEVWDVIWKNYPVSVMPRIPKVVLVLTYYRMYWLLNIIMSPNFRDL